MATDKYRTADLDYDYLLDSGLLFEMNRQFLHPLGMALAVKVSNGVKQLAIKDFRNEPEKVLFGKEVIAVGRQKFEEFLKDFGFGQMERRRVKLGYSTQHAECWV